MRPLAKLMKVDQVMNLLDQMDDDDDDDGDIITQSSCSEDEAEEKPPTVPVPLVKQTMPSSDATLDSLCEVRVRLGRLSNEPVIREEEASDDDSDDDLPLSALVAKVQPLKPRQESPSAKTTTKKASNRRSGLK